MNRVKRGARIILSLLIVIICSIGTIDVLANKVTTEQIRLKDVFDEIIIEDEQVPLSFTKLEQTEAVRVCVIHVGILLILIIASMLMLLFRKKQKVYLIELGTVALLVVVLCTIGSCKLDWIVTIIGAIWLEIMNIIFDKKLKTGL